VVARLVAGLLAAACLSSTGVYASPPETADEFDELPMNMNNPGSIVERLEEDAEPKDYLFQLPGVTGVLKPWYDMKADLDRKHGFRFGISYTSFYQKASDTFGPEDDAASFDLDISGTWTFLGHGTDSPTMLGFDFFWRDNYGSKIPPQTLFTQYGALYSGAAPYGENDPAIKKL